MPQKKGGSFEAFKRIVDKYYPALEEIAHDYGLTIYRDKTTHKSWNCGQEGTLVELTNRRTASHLPRQGFNITYDSDKPDTVYVWCFVERLAKNGQRGGDNKHVKLDALEAYIKKTIKELKKYLKENSRIDPEEAEKKNMGTRYLWSWEYESCSEEAIWSFENREQDLYANLTNYGDNNDWVVSLYGLNDQDCFELNAESVHMSAKAIIKKLEKLIDLGRDKIKVMTEKEFKKIFK
jgi:hypothetical protein